MHDSEDYNGKKALVFLGVFYVSESSFFFSFLMGTKHLFYIPKALA